jgi:hypothetical protein
VQFKRGKAQFVPVFGLFLQNPPAAAAISRCLLVVRLFFNCSLLRFLLLRSSFDRPELRPLPSSRSDPARLLRTVAAAVALIGAEMGS